MMKLKGAFVALSFFMAVGSIFSGSALANPTCGTLEECQSLRTYLQSQLTQVDARIEELLRPETRTTITGAVFTRDRSHAALNEAWRDPDGLIWGDLVKKTNGTVHDMNHYEATSYCALIDARLPTREEFIRLREYMGAQSGTHEGYSPQVLPNLSDYWFWSSSVNPGNAGIAFTFVGSYGGIAAGARRNSIGAIRCVVGASLVKLI